MEKNKRDLYKWRMLLAFILTNIIFILIFLLSFSVSYLNYQGISSQNNLIQRYLIDLDSLVKESTCDSNLLFKSSERLDIVGSKLSLLETRFGKHDPRVIEQKYLYNQLEIKHFNIIKNIQMNCGKDFITLLFFYSNNEPFNKESERMGYILSSFKKENPEKIMIYSFDYNLDIPLINELKTTYNVSNAPIVIINEYNRIYVKNIEDLEKYLLPGILEIDYPLVSKKK